MTFRSSAMNNEDDHIPPPDPYLLRIYTAFARVLHVSGVGDYVDIIEREMIETDSEVIREDGKTDVGLLISSRLAVTTV